MGQLVSFRFSFAVQPLFRAREEGGGGRQGGRPPVSGEPPAVWAGPLSTPAASRPAPAARVELPGVALQHALAVSPPVRGFVLRNIRGIRRPFPPRSSDPCTRPP